MVKRHETAPCDVPLATDDVDANSTTAPPPLSILVMVDDVSVSKHHAVL